MPDAYATITDQPPELVRAMADAMEIRAATPQYRAMLEGYLTQIEFPEAASVLEVGCGAGPVADVLARWPGVAHVTGLDPSPVMLAIARELRGGIANLSFREGSAYELPNPKGSVDVVVFHTTLTHLPQPDVALAEAFRVLRPGGWLAVFDGDYETIDVSNHQLDPLQLCADSFKEFFVNDLRIVRRLPSLVSHAGFEVVHINSHGYLEAMDAGYLLTILDRGADALVNAGSIGEDLADAMKREARRRAEAREFFGHISFASLIGRKAI